MTISLLIYIFFGKEHYLTDVMSIIIKADWSTGKRIRYLLLIAFANNLPHLQVGIHIMLPDEMAGLVE